jgi:hypothetical protein
LKPILET